MLDLRVIWDITGANLNGLTIPAGVGAALYITGSGGVPATATQRAAHPGAVLIDQSPANTPDDELADVADMEAGAVTLADLPGWYEAALLSYQRGTRPGQRRPAVYCSASRVTEVANTFVAGRIDSGPRLWVASWDAPVESVIDTLVSSGGPFPVIGVQVKNEPTHDVSLFRGDWLDSVSRPPAARSPYPVDQDGVIVSFTTKGTRRVTSHDSGVTWR